MNRLETSIAGEAAAHSWPKRAQQPDTDQEQAAAPEQVGQSPPSKSNPPAMRT